jgi:phosphate transport system substrate-binding protein
VRLGNNFSGATQAKMIDVKRFLPFESGSDLEKADTDFRLSGELPVLDGAAALVPVYASVINSVYPEGSVTYEGGSFSDDNYYGENFADGSKMRYFNTVRGYKAIVDGTTDLFFSAAPSQEQKEYAEKQGVELVYEPIGREAFVFFVNEKNPVSGLTSAQVRDIYSGNILNWADVGGANRFINPVTRLKGSGSQSVMERFMGETKIEKKNPFGVLGASIGYSFRYYLNDMVGNQAVKMISLNGVYPNTENIKNGSYPLVYQFYAVYRKDNQNENVKKLIDWTLSSEGQDLIEQCGYAGINTNIQ